MNRESRWTWSRSYIQYTDSILPHWKAVLFQEMLQGKPCPYIAFL